jgi:hypothetical protein
VHELLGAVLLRDREVLEEVVGEPARVAHHVADLHRAQRRLVLERPARPGDLRRPNAGIHVATGSTSWNFPSSNSVISAVQTIGLVIEYRR